MRKSVLNSVTAADADLIQAEIDALHGRAPAEPVVPVYGPGIKTPGKGDVTGTAPQAVAPDAEAPETD